MRPAWGAALVVCLALVLSAQAGPAPNSLRVEKVGEFARLTWEPGEGFYGIYRSPDPADVVRPAWLIWATVDTSYDDPLDAGRGNISFYLVDDAERCSNNAQCDDFNECNGIEECSLAEGICRSGAPIPCNDSNACTIDSCDETLGQCVYEELSCEDGDSCTLDTCDPARGCVYSIDPEEGVGRAAKLAGRALGQFPHFEYTRAFNEGDTVVAGVDPSASPELVGQTCDLYLLEERGAQGWCAGDPLADARGTPDSVTISAGSILDNSFSLAGSASLSSDAGDGVGRGYDIALDCDRDGFLDADELADGLEGEAGLYVVKDLTTLGPLATASFDDIGPLTRYCSSGGTDDMRVYYPTTLEEPSFDGTYPLVVISHGNGHCFDWYDFLGEHIASYGYIVMAHDNDTRPGIETSSTTTLEFTDKILREQATLGGGVINGHIDSSRIAWVGHSRGGEGVARAYDRLVDEGWPAEFYSADDIVVISSIAPTDFLGRAESNPHDKPYHLLYGSADGDVCGCPNNAIAQSFGLFERALGPRHSTYVHGADHNDFNCCGFNDFTGPSGTEIGRSEAQQVQKAATLALIEYYVEKQVAPKDYLWRQYEALRPPGVDPGTVVVHEHREAPPSRVFVIDDFQDNVTTNTSSSGEPVTFSVDDAVEARMRETDNFEWTGGEPMNGMTRGRIEDTERGLVFSFGDLGNAFLSFDVAAEARDFRAAEFLSFRAAQGTRHPKTISALEDLVFDVSLVDALGNESTISIGAYGGGIEEPYQRGGFGVGAGWQNEFETIRIRISDFARDGGTIDLSDIRKVRFDFGPAHGGPEGRVAIDDLELVEE